MKYEVYKDEKIIAEFADKEDAEHFLDWKREQILFQRNDEILDKVANETGYDRRYNLYMATFYTSAKDTFNILYEGYEGRYEAKRSIYVWISDKLTECENQQLCGINRHDEILYLRKFLQEIISDD